MNYCSIQEAWGQNDYITNEYKKYNSKYNDSVNSVNSVNSIKTLEKFSSDENHTDQIKKNYNCDDFLFHLKTCSKCQNMIRDKYRPKILDKFSEILDTNKDVVVLILVGICIMLFFNLVNSVTKNNKN